MKYMYNNLVMFSYLHWKTKYCDGQVLFL